MDKRDEAFSTTVTVWPVFESHQAKDGPPIPAPEIRTRIEGWESEVWMDGEGERSGSVGQERVIGRDECGESREVTNDGEVLERIMAED